MDSNGYSLLLSSWLRLPMEDTDGALTVLREAGMLPAAGVPLTTEQASVALVALLLTMVDSRAKTDGELCRAAAGMALEGERNVDPMDVMDRTSFSELVGPSLGPKSVNGYKNFSESICAAMVRHRGNVGIIETERVVLRFDGADPVGLIETRNSKGELHVFRFTPGGRPSPTGGLLREATLGRGIMAGIAFVLDGSAVTRAAKTRPGISRTGGPKTARRQTKDPSARAAARD